MKAIRLSFAKVRATMIKKEVEMLDAVVNNSGKHLQELAKHQVPVFCVRSPIYFGAGVDLHAFVRVSVALAPFFVLFCCRISDPFTFVFFNFPFPHGNERAFLNIYTSLSHFSLVLAVLIVHAHFS